MLISFFGTAGPNSRIANMWFFQGKQGGGHRKKCKANVHLSGENNSFLYFSVAHPPFETGTGMHQGGKDFAWTTSCEIYFQGIFCVTRKR